MSNLAAAAAAAAAEEEARMSTTPPVDPAAIVRGGAGTVISAAERGVDAIVFRATGYKLPWLTPAQVLALVFPLGYSAAAAIQNLIEHHRFSVTNLWELLASSGLFAGIRLSAYLLKVLDPAVAPTEVAAVPVGTGAEVAVPLVTPPPS